MFQNIKVRNGFFISVLNHGSPEYGIRYQSSEVDEVINIYINKGETQSWIDLYKTELYFSFLGMHLQAVVVMRHKRKTADNVTGKRYNSICIVVLNTTFDLLKRDSISLSIIRRAGEFLHHFNSTNFCRYKLRDLLFLQQRRAYPLRNYVIKDYFQTFMADIEKTVDLNG